MKVRRMRTGIVLMMTVIGLAIGTSMMSAPIATAHVVVGPAEVQTSSYQTFTVSVPNEKAQPTTSVKVLIAQDVKQVTPTQKSGWNVATEKSGEGENATVTSITWSDGAIGEGLRDDFTFSAKIPDQTKDLQWKAYQTYADGTVVSWDKDGEHGHDEEGGNSGPLSVTKVVVESAETQALKKAQKEAMDSRTTAERALYLGATAIIVSLVGVCLATRNRSTK